MDKNNLNDPKFRCSLILDEFRSGKPIYECFKNLCKRMEPDFVMEYREFDFWFHRFTSGNFDINYDMSLEPKTRQFTDLPINIFKKITGSLGPLNRIVLRKVCKTFRTVVDNWDPKVKGELVNTVKTRINFNVIDLIFNDESFWRYCCDSENYTPVTIEKNCTVKPNYGERFEQEGNYLDVAVDDLLSILCHPKLKLASFGIDTGYVTSPEITEKFAKKLVQRMETCTHGPQIHAEKVHFSCAGSIEELKILKFFKAGTVKNLKIGNPYTMVPHICLNEQSIESVTKEIEGLELWETLEEVNFLPSILEDDEDFSLLRVVHAPKMTMTFSFHVLIRFNQISKTLLQDHPRLQWCTLKYNSRMETPTAKMHLENLGATPLSDSYKFPIPNSDSFFEIKIDDVSDICWISVFIERKQNTSE